MTNGMEVDAELDVMQRAWPTGGEAHNLPESCRLRMLRQ